MGDLVNLKSVRKAKARLADAAAADANRAKFGRTKTEKARDSVESARRERELDEARLERD